ncbi:MAG: nicotinamidase [delta proteobacterium ML8_F1]|nr:MAG: nicotinamidase [delta proteobacterium ML8_F1]
MKKALIVIDMLKDFLDEDGVLTIGDSANLIENVASRIAVHRREGHPVIYLMDQHREDDLEFNMFPPHCIKGTPGGDIVEALAPLKGDFLIAKRRYSGFFGTDLDLTLRDLKITEVELAGVCTQICVLYTAADARMLNYGVTLYEAAVASFDPEAHDFALKEMSATLGVKVIAL